MNVEAVLVAGGAGLRLDAGRPKALVSLGGKPLFVHSLEVFEKSPSVQGVVLVAPGGYADVFESIVRKRRLKKVRKIIAGGAARCDSVLNGLKETAPETRLVVVHDAARPFLTSQLLKAAVEGCRRDKAVVVAVPVKPTIKQVRRGTTVVRQTLDRRDLWEAQTPQVFDRNVLLKAYAKRGRQDPTDDAMLVESAGVKVRLIPGDYANIKITTREDLDLAEFFLKRRKRGTRR